MNKCACNSMSLHNGKDSLLYRLCFESSRGENIVVVIQGVDIVDGRRLLHLAIFSLCSVVSVNGRQIYLSLSEQIHCFN